MCAFFKQRKYLGIVIVLIVGAEADAYIYMHYTLCIGHIRVLFLAQLQILARDAADTFLQSQYWFYYSYSVYCVFCDRNNLTCGCLTALQV